MFLLHRSPWRTEQNRGDYGAAFPDEESHRRRGESGGKWRGGRREPVGGLGARGGGWEGVGRREEDLRRGAGGAPVMVVAGGMDCGLGRSRRTRRIRFGVLLWRRMAGGGSSAWSGSRRRQWHFCAVPVVQWRGRVAMVGLEGTSGR